MIIPGFMGVLTASISVSEEIEGRTAITLMSKPVSRRQFLLGKYAGILLASFAMTLFLGWLLVWVVLLDLFPLPGIEPPPDPAWTVSLGQQLFPGNPAEHLIRGMALWTHDAGLAAPNVLIGFCQVMVLVALAVALATRLPMVVTLSACLVIYFLGNLTSILTEVTRSGFRLVYFVAQLFDTLLPGLNLFDVGNAIVRDVPLPVDRYWWYALNVVFYGVIYSGIVLLFGLVLFEDRDLA
jgi:ABC-type Na+ efflux pump permease subunit